MALGGDLQARARLLERLRPRIVLWVSARLSNRLRKLVDPEDVAQEVLIAVHQALDSYQDRSPRGFHAWLFRIAENRIRDLSDYASARKRQPGEPIVPTQTTPSTAAMRSEAFERVRAALLRLPDDYRRVIQLRRLEEREVPAIAGEMGRSENAVRILYCRALKALRDAMVEEA